jgi:arabinofuranosyltransferase
MENETEKPHKAWSELGLVGLALLIPRLVGLFSLNLFDDAYITFRHVTNLVDGHGYVFNAGERILGTTSPLFGALLVPGALLGIAPPVTAVLLGVCADILSAYLGYRLLLAGAGRVAAVTFVALFAIDPSLIRIGVGGMESSVFFALVMVWATWMANDRRGPAIVLSAFAVFVRPEGLALGLLALIGLWQRPRSARAAFVWSALSAAVLGLGALALYIYYGTPVPQSLASKGRDVGGSALTVLRMFFTPPNGAYGQWGLTLLAVFGMARAYRCAPALRWLFGWALLYVLAFVVGRPVMWPWYALPIYGVKAIAAAVFLAGLVERLRLARFVRLPAALAMAALASCALALAGGRSPVQRLVYDPLETWCRSHVAPGQTIAAGDVGVVGYYSSAYVYDLAGLVWPERWRYQTIWDVIRAKEPDFVLANVSSSWSPLYEADSELRQHYRPEARFSRFSEVSLAPDPARLPKEWRQDYVIFRRVATHSASAR